MQVSRILAQSLALTLAVALGPGCAPTPHGSVDLPSVDPGDPPPPPPPPPPPDGAAQEEPLHPCEDTALWEADPEWMRARCEPREAGSVGPPDEAVELPEPEPQPQATAADGAALAGATARPRTAHRRAPAGLEFCAAIGDSARPEDCALQDEVSPGAPPGVASLGAATEMQVGQDYPVRLIVGREERREQIEAAARQLGQASTGAIRLAPWICAELHATGFAVTGEREQCKRRGASPQVSFAWDVSPERAGRHLLSATVRALAEEDGEATDQIDSNSVEVTVEAGFDRTVEQLTESGTRVRDLLLVIAGILAVLSVIVWRIRKLGSKPDAAAAADSPAG